MFWFDWFSYLNRQYPMWSTKFLEHNFYIYAWFSRLFRIKNYKSSDTRNKVLVLFLKGINLVILCSSKLVFRLKISLSVAEDKLNFVTLVAQLQH